MIDEYGLDGGRGLCNACLAGLGIPARGFSHEPYQELLRELNRHYGE